MKTHQFANALNQLAAALKSLPNTEIDKFCGNMVNPRATGGENTSAGVAVNLATLAALSRVGKQQWLQLIKEWDLPLTFPASDSARNVMGRIMKYLDENPREISRLQQGAIKKSQASPALMKALSIIMSGPTNEESQSRD